MSFENKFGITKLIEGRRNNLSVSFDTDTPRIKKDEVGMVFLYTPDMEDTNTHYHITLNKDEILILKNWIDSFLNESDMLERYNQDLKRKGN